MKFFDRYNIFARVLPVILISLPFFVLYYFLLKGFIEDFVLQVVNIPWIPDVGFTLAIIYLLIQLNRFISKELFEKRIFSDGLFLPTTNFLMHSDSYYTIEYTRKIHLKIYNDFKIGIPSMEEELKNEINSRQKIREAVALIRLKIGDGVRVLQHNIEYGFVRNLIGGSIIATVMSLINIVAFSWITFNKNALIISCVLGVLYFALAIFGKSLIRIFGINYAQVLIQEYMAEL